MTDLEREKWVGVGVMLCGIAIFMLALALYADEHAPSAVRWFMWLAPSFLLVLGSAVAVANGLPLQRTTPLRGVDDLPALVGLEGRMTRVKRSAAGAQPAWVTGRLHGERVEARVWTTPDAPIRTVVSVEAAVPLAVTATFQRGANGPELEGGRPVPEPYRDAGLDAALRALLLRARHVTVGLRGLEARSQEVLDERDLLATVHALVTLAGFVRTDTPSPPDPVARLLATRSRPPVDADGAPTRSGGQVVCPFCRDDVDARADTVACAGCATLHHAECWAENGRCTVRGCERDLARRVPDL